MGAQSMDLSTLESLFEAELESSFNPVQPDPEFVSRLRRKLSENEQVVLEPRSSATAFVLVALGLFTGALLVWILRRLR
jgi:hypothetical protein